MLRLIFATSIILSSLSLSAGTSAAFEAVTEKRAFLEIINGKDLTRLGIRLNVTEAGQIQGKAFGRQVTGRWVWSNDGYFCRDLFYGSRDMGPNCQMVKVQGETLRFISDRGEGIYADLYLR